MRRIAFLVVLLSLRPALAADPAEVLKDADRAFAALAQKEGPGPAFRAYAADPVTILNAVQPMKRPDEVGRGFGPDTKIVWEPEDAKIAASGDLGYTWGHATISDKDKNGQPVTSYSRYVTVWQKQADGHWKFVLDFGAPDPSRPNIDVRRFAKPFAAAIAVWELASFTGYGAYAAFAGIAGFLVMWLLDSLYRRWNPVVAAVDEGEEEPAVDDAPPSTTRAPPPWLVSDRTSVW